MSNSLKKQLNKKKKKNKYKKARRSGRTTRDSNNRLACLGVFFSLVLTSDLIGMYHRPRFSLQAPTTRRKKKSIFDHSFSVPGREKRSSCWGVVISSDVHLMLHTNNERGRLLRLWGIGPIEARLYGEEVIEHVVALFSGTVQVVRDLRVHPHTALSQFRSRSLRSLADLRHKRATARLSCMRPNTCRTSAATIIVSQLI